MFTFIVFSAFSYPPLSIVACIPLSDRQTCPLIPLGLALIYRFLLRVSVVPRARPFPLSLTLVRSIGLASPSPFESCLVSLPASSLPARRTFDSNRRDLKVKRPLLAKLPGSPTTRDGCSLQAMRCYLVGSCMFKSLSFLRSTLGIGQPSVLASSPFLT